MSKAENAAFLDGILTDIYFVLVQTNHDARHSWTADHTRKNCAWCIVTSETGLADAGAIVDHDSRYLFLHFDEFKQL